MQINKLKINNYGNIKEKELKLARFNIIYGKNESGKSTLLNYIISSFYGISRNKGRKSESDFDRFTPWNESEYSGTIEYTLDNGKKYYVFRDFTKKNPQILDENSNDISKNFTVDKKNGAQFIFDQIGVDRNLIESTVISEQKSVELDDSTQSQLLQKIANLTESGDEEISFRQLNNKIDKILLNEVGTEKSQERPINITNRNITELNEKINDIKLYQKDKDNLEAKKQQFNEQINEEEGNKIIYNKIKDILEKNNIETEKIKAKQSIIEETNKKIQDKKIKLDEIKDKGKKSTKITAIMLLLCAIIGILGLCFIKNKLLPSIILCCIPIIALFGIIKKRKNSNSYLNEQIEILNKNNNELQKEIDEMTKKLKEKNEIEKDEMISRYGKNILELFNNGIYEIIKQNNEQINSLKIEKHKVELELNMIEEKFNKLADYEEQIESEKERLSELEEKAETIKLTKNILEDAYIEMKNSITPKFNQNLSENIKLFSNGKYKKVIIDNGLYVILNNGEKIPIDKLSIGTIEQIYLALRLSVINEISKERLPIILDESFAYYDDERLSETLKYLYKIENQVIILSCTDRERNVLERNGAEFNYLTI